MPIFTCPNCNRDYILPDHQEDFICNCAENVEASDALRFEDVVMIGDWDDFTGSDTIPGNVAMNQGRSNIISSVKARVDGAFVPPLTVRGHSKQTTRQRDYLEYINLGKDANVRKVDFMKAAKD